MSIKPFTVIVSIFFLAYSQAAIVGRIYGAEIASAGQFPYQVSLRLNGTHICGGSILSEEIIVTAAECVAEFYWKALPVKYFQVQAGSNDRFFGGALVNVSYIEINRLFNISADPKSLNDLAVVKLAEPLVYSELIQPIEMDEEVVPPGTDVITSGWGTSSAESKVVPEFLEYSTLQLITKKKCLLELGLYFDLVLCLAHESGKGICEGDAGDPAVLNGKLVGVASASKNSCGGSSPDVYASIAYHASWIKQIMRQISKY